MAKKRDIFCVLLIKNKTICKPSNSNPYLDRICGLHFSILPKLSGFLQVLCSVFLSKTKRFQIPCYKKLSVFFLLFQVSTLNERLERKETELSEFKTKYDQEYESWKSEVSDVLCELTQRWQLLGRHSKLQIHIYWYHEGIVSSRFKFKLSHF